MTTTTAAPAVKMQLLGEISERARQLEAEMPLDVRRNAIAQDLAWSARRAALVEEAAQALNWLLAGDTVTP